jgi:hypothetical protein
MPFRGMAETKRQGKMITSGARSGHTSRWAAGDPHTHGRSGDRRGTGGDVSVAEQQGRTMPGVLLAVVRGESQKSREGHSVTRPPRGPHE